MSKQIVFTAPQIRAFLYSLKKCNVNDTNNRRGIINIFPRAVYLWDDKLVIILNGGDKPITIDDILLGEIEADNAEFECSLMVAEAPPEKTPSARPAGFLPLYSGKISIKPFTKPFVKAMFTACLIHVRGAAQIR